MKEISKSKFVKILIFVLIGLWIAVSVAVLSVNGHVVNTTQSKIITADEAILLSDVDCVLVLGCLVKNDGTPSDMLEDRLKSGIVLYESGVSDKMLMSGDHGQVEYNEVTAMKEYAIESGVDSNDVFCDHAGFSTYESIYRAKEIFGADKIVIVTQKYHLYRALYIAEAFGIEAYGVSSDLRTYSGQTVRDIREILARCKDFIMSGFKPEPTYLGEKIDISGEGDITNG